MTSSSPQALAALFAFAGLVAASNAAVCCRNGKTYANAGAAKSEQQEDCNEGTCEIFIGETHEGSSYNKVVELYNPTSADVKLADYHLVLYYNGNTKAGANLDNAMRGATIKAFSSFTICSNRHSDKSICDAEDSRVAHNGDDVWELLKGSTLIDTFGVRGIRSNWKVCGVYGGKDKTLIRKPRVTMGAAKWASSSGTSCDNCEWMVWPKDYFENGGTHFHWNQVLVAEVDANIDGVSFKTDSDCHNFMYAFHAKVGSCLSTNAVQYTCAAAGSRSAPLFKEAGCKFVQEQLSLASQGKLTVACADWQGGKALKSNEGGVQSINAFLMSKSAKMTVVEVDESVCCPDGGTYKTAGDALKFGQAITDCKKGHCSVIISEVQEGSALNKVVELFNPTRNPVPLKNYRLRVYANGGTSNPTELIKPDTGVVLDPFTSYTICNPKHSDTTVCDLEANLLINGDDAIELWDVSVHTDEVLIDVFGKKGVREVWGVCGVKGAGQDHTVIRKPGVNMGVRDWAKSAGTKCADCEWVVMGKDHFLNHGLHVHANSLMAAYDEGRGVSFASRDQCQAFGLALNAKLGFCEAAAQPSMGCANMTASGTFMLSFKDTASCDKAGKALVAALDGVAAHKCGGCLGVVSLGLGPLAAAEAARFVGSQAVASSGAGAVYKATPVCCNGKTYVSIKAALAAREDEAFCSLDGCGLLISEAQEGSGYNKLVELYNPTDAAIALKEYSLSMYHNGATDASFTIKTELADKTVKARGTFTVCNVGHKDKGACDVETKSFSPSGDDVVELMKGASVIDTFGRKGEVSVFDVCGVKGASKDHTLVRKPHVQSGTTSWGKSAGLDCGSCEWVVQPKDHFLQQGAHAHYLPKDDLAWVVDTAKNSALSPLDADTVFKTKALGADFLFAVQAKLGFCDAATFAGLGVSLKAKDAQDAGALNVLLFAKEQGCVTMLGALGRLGLGGSCGASKTVGKGSFSLKLDFAEAGKLIKYLVSSSTPLACATTTSSAATTVTTVTTVTTTTVAAITTTVTAVAATTKTKTKTKTKTTTATATITATTTDVCTDRRSCAAIDASCGSSGLSCNCKAGECVYRSTRSTQASTEPNTSPEPTTATTTADKAAAKTPKGKTTKAGAGATAATTKGSATGGMGARTTKKSMATNDDDDDDDDDDGNTESLGSSGDATTAAPSSSSSSSSSNTGLVVGVVLACLLAIILAAVGGIIYVKKASARSPGTTDHANRTAAFTNPLYGEAAPDANNNGYSDGMAANTAGGYMDIAPNPQQANTGYMDVQPGDNV